jgi:hypothetical protein
MASLGTVQANNPQLLNGQNWQGLYGGGPFCDKPSDP